MIIMIDNFDSFTYNIVQYIQMLGYDITTIRNNKITVKELQALNPSHLIISPGPGNPHDAGISIAAIKAFAGKIPILGICLGHQAIVEAFGGKVVGAGRIVHGKKEAMQHDERGLFRNMPQHFQAVRYHSLAAEQRSLPKCLEITATSVVDSCIMGVRHKQHLVEGLQFHPESIGTENGMQLLKNFFTYHREAPQKLKLLNTLSTGVTLNHREAITLMDEITDGELTDAQIASALSIIAMRGITADELSAFASVLRAKTGLKRSIKGLLDTCGTGGDGKHTFNISTAAALVCASLGVPVAKHGNRAITSRSGSFDFLQALNIKTDNDLNQAITDLKERNFSFFFAPQYHSAMKHVAKVRQELKFKTAFNLLGPLVNPMYADYQVVGVYSETIMDAYIAALKKLGLKRALVVHGAEGLDEISICGKTYYRELHANGLITTGVIDPELFKIKGFKLTDLAGGSGTENAETFKGLIGTTQRTKRQEAITTAIALNAGAGLYISGHAQSIADGYQQAKTQIMAKEFNVFMHNLEQAK